VTFSCNEPNDVNPEEETTKAMKPTLTFLIALLPDHVAFARFNLEWLTSVAKSKTTGDD
jgi:hypothetical protein